MSIGSSALSCFTANVTPKPWRSGGFRVYQPSGDTPECGGVHSEPGTERAGILYQQVLGRELGWLDDRERAKRPARLPVVLTQAEVRSLLAHLDGRHELMAKLLYGAGLRLMECVRQRVKDADFERGEILVRDGKGGKDRVTLLPQSATEPLKNHLEKVRAVHENDLAAGFGESICRLPWRESTKMRPGSGAGSMVSRPPCARLTRVPGRSGVITSTRSHCNGREKRRARLSNSETGDLPHLSPFLCDPSTGVRL